MLPPRPQGWEGRAVSRGSRWGEGGGSPETLHTGGGEESSGRGGGGGKTRLAAPGMGNRDPRRAQAAAAPSPPRVHRGSPRRPGPARTHLTATLTQLSGAAMPRNGHRDRAARAAGGEGRRGGGPRCRGRGEDTPTAALPARERTETRSQWHTVTHSHTLMCTHTDTETHTHGHAHTDTHSLTCTHTDNGDTHTQTHSDTHSNIRSHTITYRDMETHTQTC